MNPLHSRHQKAPTASAAPPTRINAPTTVASVVMIGKPSMIVATTINAIPRITSQVHLLRISWSSWRITRPSGISGKMVVYMDVLWEFQLWPGFDCPSLRGQDEKNPCMQWQSQQDHLDRPQAPDPGWSPQQTS